MFNFFKKKRKNNPYCECIKDCGAKITYSGSTISKQWCPTVVEELIKPFREYPWNQIGDGVSLVIDETNQTWELIGEKKNE